MGQSSATPEPIGSPPNHNQSFKPDSFLQLAWDSTSMGALKTCPRFYQYSIVEGWTPRATSHHLTFGIWYHGALERYDHAKSAGQDHWDALDAALDWLLRETWNSTLGRPWISDDKYKNRETLIRTVVWYLLQFEVDPMTTVQLENGKPAVELSFRFPISHQTSQGETYLLCGHLDRVVNYQGSTYVLDRKTTKSALGSDFFAKFSPDNQMSTYSFAGQIIYQTPVVGIIIDGAQVGIGFSRFQRGMVLRTPAALDEWYRELGFWFHMAEDFAKHHYWPQNDKACGQYGGCAFRAICGRSPAARQQWLQSGFHRRTWDPLVSRGDI